jgi:hypothetical protein
MMYKSDPVLTNLNLEGKAVGSIKFSHPPFFFGLISEGEWINIART